MKKTTFYRVPFLLLLIISCSKQPKERVLTLKDVFPTQQNTDSTIVLDLDKLREGNYMCEEIENRNQFVKVNEQYYPVILSLSIYCRGVLFCPKGRNTIEVEVREDSNNFSGIELLEVNGFSKLLRKQFLNRGKNPDYADNPYKSIVLLRYDDLTKKSQERVSKALDTISISYFNFIRSFEKLNIDSLKRIYPLQILLEKDLRRFDEIDNLPIPTPLKIIE